MAPYREGLLIPGCEYCVLRPTGTIPNLGYTLFICYLDTQQYLQRIDFWHSYFLYCLIPAGCLIFSEMQQGDTRHSSLHDFALIIGSNPDFSRYVLKEWRKIHTVPSPTVSLVSTQPIVPYLTQCKKEYLLLHYSYKTFHCLTCFSKKCNYRLFDLSHWFLTFLNAIFFTHHLILRDIPL